MNHTAYLLLGGNIGDRKKYLQEGVTALEETCGTVIRQSACYETAPWGKEDQQAFLNAAVELSTDLTAVQLLAEIGQIEARSGRQRQEVWGARTLDIDIIFYDDSVIQTPKLTVPHPFLQDRRFALVPLAELAPDFVHPVLKKKVSQLLDECSDHLPVTALPK